ncbi:chemotaxis protein CheB [Sediminicoccus sp. KRV36]|uniref:chemotaxis protein CheB n=1 Tax=Sediminicoccus sp. KRV36 TaxID=3133721 RepID=UPI00200F00E0|nr:chemotaxis protein CheB [Sediminicoccus rosea]UPY38244.1 chemotaxis protein CheB [Sediminicoccus rosea]
MKPLFPGPASPGVSPPGPIPVLIVDDSAFMRIALRRIIEAEGDLRVVAEAADGEAAIAAVRQHQPAVVAMDVEMPVLGGIEATRRIMALPNPPAIIMVSQHTQADSPAAIAAIAAGASDYISKEAGLGGLDLGHLDQALRGRLRHWARQRYPLATDLPVPRAAPKRIGPPDQAGQAPPPLILIAASTGGPDALAALLAASGPLPVPVLIAQHMPEGLAPELARLLARRAGWPVCVAENGQRVTATSATLLPTDGVLLRALGGFALRLAPNAGAVHPSADLLFRSAALLGLAACGVVLTGMGQDGAAGAAALAAEGGRILVQSTETSVVAGMPQAASSLVAEAEALSPEALGLALRAMWRA